MLVGCEGKTGSEGATMGGGEELQGHHSRASEKKNYMLPVVFHKIGNFVRLA